MSIILVVKIKLEGKESDLMSCWISICHLLFKEYSFVYQRLRKPHHLLEVNKIIWLVNQVQQIWFEVYAQIDQV